MRQSLLKTQEQIKNGSLSQEEVLQAFQTQVCLISFSHQYEQRQVFHTFINCNNMGKYNVKRELKVKIGYDIV